MYQRFAAQLRSAGIKCDIFLNNNKFRSQLNYADKNGFDIAILGRSEELDSDNIILKYLRENRQETINMHDLVPTIQSYLESKMTVEDSKAEETKSFDASTFESQVSDMASRITSIFVPKTTSTVNVNVMPEQVTLDDYASTVNAGDVTVFWYVGSRGLKSGSVELYKEPIQKILTKGGYVYLLDLAAWSAFFFKGGSVKKAHSFRDTPHLRMLHTNGFFRNLLGKMQDGRYVKTLETVFQNKSFYDVSKNYADFGLNLMNVFGDDNVGVVGKFLDPSMDTSKCYSAFQFVEMLYIVDTITGQVVKNKVNINFVLPNDEAKYYVTNGNTSMLTDMLEEYISIKDTQVNVNLMSFEYGEKLSDRPYNSGKNVKA